ncbi:MAG TPA: putative LPS assembly protein LptD, partial [Bacteroidia bacterium]|nr:putative LPS assembly protein LptD [Bacteroidia bacterium]
PIAPKILLKKVGFLSFGVDNILEMKTRQVTDTAVNLKKIKILEGFSLNTGYNLAATQFKWSVLNMAARTTILEKFTLNGTAVFDPYAIDSSGLRINAFQYNNNGNLFRFTNATVALGFSLNSVMFNDKDKTNSGYYKIPWNLTFSYSYNYSKPALTAVKTQTLYCFGDFSMTERWRINFSSGWDFIAKDVSYTQLAIVRDLHCWEMRLSWVPFGLQQNYFFTINVKAGMLRDLKLDKKRDQFDR